MNKGRGKINTLAKAFAVLLLFFLPGIAFAAEKINDYVVEITINPDSTIEVFETIEYDFGTADRHGIYRDIPIKYDAKVGKRSVRVDVKSVSRDGYSETFTEKRSGNDKRLRIGDANMTISGVHTYRIGYHVEGAFNAFADFDELYWNAIPTGWNVPISHARVKVTAPEAFTQADCYQGTYGASGDCAIATLSGKAFEAEGTGFDPYEGMTIAVALPKGAVALPSPLQQFMWWISSNFVIFIPFFVFLYMYRLWDAKGRDAKGKGTIVARYDPPIALSPIFLGTVVDAQLDDRDITADILYLAEQGFLTITRMKERTFLIKHTDYVLEWVGDEKDLAEKEKLVVDLLFGSLVVPGKQVKLSELQKDTSLQKRRKKLKEHIDKELKRQGYFANRPHYVRQKFFLISFILGLFLFVFWFVNILLSISLAISLLIIAVFGVLMPKRTPKGAEIRDHILGFKEFLSVTEKERLDFHNAPERSPKEFMEHLPYAVALGVEKKWAEQFKGIAMDPPSWFRGGTTANFAPAAFVSDLNSFSTSLRAGVTAAQGGSGSGGGGFSGGGVGGGGGGSW